MVSMSEEKRSNCTAAPAALALANETMAKNP
jgi:hypothetical protein